MAKKSESSKAIEYVRWIHPAPRAVLGYGILVPGSIHRVADLPGNPLQQLGITFEPAEGPEVPNAKHGGEA